MSVGECDIFYFYMCFKSVFYLKKILNWCVIYIYIYNFDVLMSEINKKSKKNI